MSEPARRAPLLSVAVTIDDLVAGGLAFARRPGRLRTSFLNWLVGVGFAGAVLWGVLWGMDGHDALTVLVGIVLGALISMALFSVIWWTGLRRRLRRSAMRGDFGPTDPSQVWADGDGIHDQTPSTGVTQSYDYTQIEGIDQTHKYVFIWVSPTKALIIPWRVGRDQVAVFVDEIGRHRRDHVRRGLS